MHLFIHRLMRLVLILAVALTCAGPSQSAHAEGSLPAQGKLQNWKLANGDLVQAAIISYSRHNRVITLELPSGKRVHVAPRDLAGASKFNWLMSDAFLLSLAGYKVPDDAALRLLQSCFAIFLGGFLGLFLAFWLAVSLLTGHRSLRRAVAVFLKSSLFGLCVAILGILIAWSLGKFFDHSSLITMLISIVYLVSLGLILAMICRIIGNQYGISEWTGIHALFLALILFGAGSLIVFIGMPRAMNQPGIDEWLTEQVLTPLELA